MPDDCEEHLDKTRRARAAVGFYAKSIVPPRPRPDGEPDRGLNAILDRLAADLVDLAGYLSESARWLEFAAQPTPPAWALPFLSAEELAALGLPPPPPLRPEADRAGECRLRAPSLQRAIDQYDQLRQLNTRTGRPMGEVR